jgi:tetratricopeptide (TPR) repeat protein
MKQLLVQNQRKVKARQQAVKITAASQVRAVAAAATRVARLPKTEKEPERELKASAVEQEATQPQSEVVVPAQVSEQMQPQLQDLQNQADASMVLAKQYLDNRQFFEARKLLQSMDQSMHQSPVYWARLGYAQYHLGGYGEAVRCYERSLALDDQQPNRYYNLALAYQAAGNKPRAMSSLDKALRLDPGNAKYQETKQGLAA